MNSNTQQKNPMALALGELRRATEKFPTWPTDPLHALAVLGEEFGELTKAVLQHTYEPHKSTRSDVRKEAIQTAAMALRFVMSLDAYQFARCAQHDQEEVPERDESPHAALAALRAWCPPEYIQDVEAVRAEFNRLSSDNRRLQLADEAIKAVQMMRSTPIVDDDFPEMRDRADLAINRYQQAVRA